MSVGRFEKDADLAAYFDSIPHGRLMERVRESIRDGRILDLLEGWLKNGRRRTFESIDRMVRRRLRAMLLDRKKKRGARHTLNDHRTWRLSFFKKAGLFSMVTAHRLRHQPH